MASKIFGLAGCFGSPMDKLISAGDFFGWQGWPGLHLVNLRPPGPIDRAPDLRVHAVPQIEELLRPGRQRLAAQGARLGHALLLQLREARLAELVAARQLPRQG